MMFHSSGLSVALSHMVSKNFSVSLKADRPVLRNPSSVIASLVIRVACVCIRQHYSPSTFSGQFPTAHGQVGSMRGHSYTILCLYSIWLAFSPRVPWVPDCWVTERNLLVALPISPSALLMVVTESRSSPPSASASFYLPQTNLDMAGFLLSG